MGHVREPKGQVAIEKSLRGILSDEIRRKVPSRAWPQARERAWSEAAARHLGWSSPPTGDGPCVAATKDMKPFAEARGYLTDEDVFRDVS